MGSSFKVAIAALAVLILVSFGAGQTKSDTVIAKKINLMFYPYVFYTPETQLAFGAGGMLYFHLDTSRTVPLSKIKLSAYYTLNKQYSFAITPSIFFPGIDMFNIEADLRYQKLISKFYGIGNETPDVSDPFYTQNKIRIYTEVAFKGFISNTFRSGLVFEYAYNDVYDYEGNPNMMDSTLAGKDGGNIVGLGLVALIDRRNNVSFPTKNGYYKILFTFYKDFLGSDFNYNNLLVDLRRYRSFGNEHIIALQFYANITSGTPPFFNLPALGGENRMRGYFEGRYRDRIYMTGQVEYRKIVWWRLGMVAFLGVGEVANVWKDFNIKTLKYSYGFGLRFVFDEEERINVRMDIGLGKNTSGIYFGLDEAF